MRFVLELFMLAALCIWGARLDASTPIQVVAAVGAPLAFAAVWGLWVAPRARRRLADPHRLALEYVLFLAAGAAAAAGISLAVGVILTLAATSNAVIVRRLGEPAPPVR
jgi:hypothetical protein